MHILVNSKKLHYINLLVDPFLFKPGNAGICPNRFVDCPINAAAAIGKSIKFVMPLVLTVAAETTFHIVQLPFTIQNSFYFWQGFVTKIDIVRDGNRVYFIATVNSSGK